jgi:hypothetical protein
VVASAKNHETERNNRTYNSTDSPSSSSTSEITTKLLENKKLSDLLVPETHRCMFIRGTRIMFTCGDTNTLMTIMLKDILKKNKAYEMYVNNVECINLILFFLVN